LKKLAEIYHLDHKHIRSNNPSFTPSIFPPCKNSRITWNSRTQWSLKMDSNYFCSPSQSTHWYC